METILFIYLAGFFTSAGYGAGSCFESGGNHFVGPELCTVATTVGAVAWPVLVPAAIYGGVTK
jgi:hypothetical protein